MANNVGQRDHQMRQACWIVLMKVMNIRSLRIEKLRHYDQIRCYLTQDLQSQGTKLIKSPINSITLPANSPLMQVAFA